MKRKITRITTLFATLIVFSSALFAQMTDQQVIRELSRYKTSGMTEQQIMIEMSKRGVTAGQLSRIRNRYELMGVGLDDGQTTTIPETKDNSRSNITNLPVVNRFTEQDTISPHNRIFGQDVFSKENLTFAPNANMPTPANYVLGSGDEVIINVWGNSEFNTQQTIAPDGYITLPRVGRVQLSGLNVEQAKTHIRNQLSNVIYDINSGTKIGVSVGNIRTILVNVMGEAKTPGTYTLTSFASAFHAIYAAGGINKIGSLRNIRVLRAGKTVATIDLYEYLINGNNLADISLHDGDIVMINPFSTLVQITGEIKRPMWYELLGSESLEDLIRFAGGFSGEAFRENVQVISTGKNEMDAYTVNSSQFSIFTLKNGDKVEVGNVLNDFTNRVEISGAVYRPGNYAIGDGLLTLGDLLQTAQGTKGDAFLARALLYRENPDRSRTMQAVNLDALMKKFIPDIKLQKNDHLYVPSVINLQDSLTVYVEGEVRLPGNYPYASNMAVQDIILQAGGLTESASQARVDVYRRIKDPMSTEESDISGEAFSFSLVGGLVSSSDTTFRLQPFDEVVVRSSPGYEEQQIVFVDGEVIFKGRYAKIQKDERLSSFIQRAGGLTKYANPKGARLERMLSEAEFNRTKDALTAKMKADKLDADSLNLDSLILNVQFVGIDLEEALSNPGGEDDIILLAGDVLSVPLNITTVKISGGVMYPNTVTYKKKMSLQQYIQKAGGYSRLAMKTKPFVIYMNGDVATGRWARIEPGCEIVVPERPERTPLGWQGVLGVTNSIASLALIVTYLLK